VDKTIRRNSDGSVSVHSAYTGAQERTANIDRTIQRTGEGRMMTGTCATSGGESGTFNSSVSRTENGLLKEQSLANQAGDTWQRDINARVRATSSAQRLP
jgi:hypothetical protein